MIEVIYHREQNLVTITGHARSDEYGRDLVCAAVSSLALTLTANVAHLAAQGLARQPVMKLQQGKAEIGCRVKKPHRDQVRLVFQSLCLGFELLATQWPEHVRYSVRGWE